MNAHTQSNRQSRQPHGQMRGKQWGDGSFGSLPHNIEVEQALLGAILINNDALMTVADFLTDQHFFEPIHQQIYAVCRGIIEQGKRAVPATVKTFLPENEKIGQFTVAQYLVLLQAEATTVINAVDFGHLIYDLARRRSLIGIGEEITAVAFDAPVDHGPDEQIEQAESRLYALAQADRFGNGFKTFGQSLTAAIDRASEAYQRDGHLAGLATGLNNLDSKLGGLAPTDLIVLAGRPAMGKTSLATNIALNVANAFQQQDTDQGPVTVDGGVVGFFSLEMSDEQLATRILADAAEVTSTSIRRGEINDTQFENLVQASQNLAQVPIHIDQTGAISIGQLAARARRLQRQQGLDLLVVDYIQLMRGRNTNPNNRVQEITEITTGLKALAKELNVPIVALSQLSRQVETRENKRPVLADLRESGSIEQDADVVLFVYRDEYYAERLISDPDAPDYEKHLQRYENARGKAEVIIAKSRHSSTGVAHLHFEASFTRFSDLAEDQHIPTRFD